MSCREVASMHRAVLELSGGRYRYWLRSDARSRLDGEYPLRGAYSVTGDRLTLHGLGAHFRRPVLVSEGDSIGSATREQELEERRRDDRVIVSVGSSLVLFRTQAWEQWQAGRGVFPYGVMMRTELDRVNEQDPLGTRRESLLQRPSLRHIPERPGGMTQPTGGGG